jgi:hypothetical protein
MTIPDLAHRCGNRELECVLGCWATRPKDFHCHSPLLAITGNNDFLIILALGT